jgi:hypothetical protein
MGFLLILTGFNMIKRFNLLSLFSGGRIRSLWERNIFLSILGSWLRPYLKKKTNKRKEYKSV